METRPFRSVKEAVALYGKRILAPELYANVLEEMDGGTSEHENYLFRIKSVTVELEDAKQNLQRAKERSVAMARSLSSLQEELEQTKRKLQMLKERSESEIEAVEVDGGSREFNFRTQIFEEGMEFHERRRVKADGNSNSPAQMIVAPAGGKGDMFRNSPLSSSLKKKRKKANNKTKKSSSISLIGGIFSKKK